MKTINIKSRKLFGLQALSVLFVLLTVSSCKDSKKTEIPDDAILNIKIYETVSPTQLSENEDSFQMDSIIQTSLKEEGILSSNIANARLILNEQNLDFAVIKTPDNEDRVYYYRIPRAIAETVKVTEIEATDNPDEFQLLFKFSDPEKWKDVTSRNVANTLLREINGDIIDAVIVMEPIENGNAGIVLTKRQIAKYLPMLDIEEFATEDSEE